MGSDSLKEFLIPLKYSKKFIIISSMSSDIFHDTKKGM